MKYDYIKSRPLNRQEKGRLRLAIKLDRRLWSVTNADANQISNEPNGNTPRLSSGRKSDHLIQDLLAYFSSPSAEVNQAVIDWALCYVSARILQRLISTHAQEWPERGILGLLKHSEPCLLLPREHITPDFQSFQRLRARPKTALICFAGNAHRLNMPVQLFHIYAVGSFDLVIYLRDDARQRFIYGIPGLGNNFEELSGKLREFIPRGCHTAILSASSGGLAALRIGEYLGAHKVALFSPEFSFKNISGVNDSAKLSSANTRLFFAKNHSFDTKLAKKWATTQLIDSIRWLDTSSHGTLSYLVYTNKFFALATWLAGNGECPVLR